MYSGNTGEVENWKLRNQLENFKSTDFKNDENLNEYTIKSNEEQGTNAKNRGNKHKPPADLEKEEGKKLPGFWLRWQNI